MSATPFQPVSWLFSKSGMEAVTCMATDERGQQTPAVAFRWTQGGAVPAPGRLATVAGFARIEQRGLWTLGYLPGWDLHTIAAWPAERADARVAVTAVVRGLAQLERESPGPFLLGLQPMQVLLGEAPRGDVRALLLLDDYTGERQTMFAERDERLLPADKTPGGALAALIRARWMSAPGGHNEAEWLTELLADVTNGRPHGLGRVLARLGDASLATRLALPSEQLPSSSTSTRECGAAPSMPVTSAAPWQHTMAWLALALSGAAIVSALISWGFR